MSARSASPIGVFAAFLTLLVLLASPAARGECEAVAGNDCFARARERMMEPDHLVELASKTLTLRDFALDHPFSGGGELPDGYRTRTSAGLYVVYTVQSQQQDDGRLTSYHVISMSHSGAALPVCQGKALLGYISRVLGLQASEGTGSAKQAALQKVKIPPQGWYTPMGVSYVAYELNSREEARYERLQPSVPDMADAARLLAEGRNESIGTSTEAFVQWSICCEGQPPDAGVPDIEVNGEADQLLFSGIVQSALDTNGHLELIEVLQALKATSMQPVDRCSPLPESQRKTLLSGLEVSYRVTDMTPLLSQPAYLHQVTIQVPGIPLVEVVARNYLYRIADLLGFNAESVMRIDFVRSNGQMAHLLVLMSPEQHEKYLASDVAWHSLAAVPLQLPFPGTFGPLVDIRLTHYHRAGDFLFFVSPPSESIDRIQ